MTEGAGHDHSVPHVRDVCALGYGPDVQGCVTLGTDQRFPPPEAPAQRPLLGPLETTWCIAWMVEVQRSTRLECLIRTDIFKGYTIHAPWRATTRETARDSNRW